MKTRNAFGAMFLALCAALCLMLAGSNTYAQTSNTAQAESSDDETNLDTQLYLIVGTNQDVADSKLPAALDPVIRQLRATLPFKNYRLAATLINRVKNGGRLDLRWIGGPLGEPSGAATSVNPSFSHFAVRQVKLLRTTEGRQTVIMQGFQFNARIPIQTSGPVAASGAAFPAINYENTGVATDFSMRESEPVIVGTLNVGPSGDAIILVASAKRTQR